MVGYLIYGRAFFGGWHHHKIRGLRWRVQSRRRIHPFNYPRITRAGSLKPYTLDNHMVSSVSEHIQPDHRDWNLGALSALFLLIRVEVEVLKEDDLVWNFDRNREFSVKSCYAMAANKVFLTMLLVVVKAWRTAGVTWESCLRLKSSFGGVFMRQSLQRQTCQLGLLAMPRSFENVLTHICIVPSYRRDLEMLWGTIGDD